jgi:hypothetical protein
VDVFCYNSACCDEIAERELQLGNAGGECGWTINEGKDMTETSIDNADVAAVFDSYPRPIRQRALQLRKLIFDAARDCDVNVPEETLKWGEPSYLDKKGSTVRIGWSDKSPDDIGLYFNCQTTLVETFKEVYPDELRYAGVRAILIGRNEKIPAATIRHCVTLALTYHRVKHLPLLGA